MDFRFGYLWGLCGQIRGVQCLCSILRGWVKVPKGECSKVGNIARIKKVFTCDHIDMPFCIGARIPCMPNDRCKSLQIIGLPAYYTLKMLYNYIQRTKRRERPARSQGTFQFWWADSAKWQNEIGTGKEETLTSLSRILTWNHDRGLFRSFKLPRGTLKRPEF